MSGVNKPLHQGIVSPRLIRTKQIPTKPHEPWPRKMARIFSLSASFEAPAFALFPLDGLHFLLVFRFLFVPGPFFSFDILKACPFVDLFVYIVQHEVFIP